MEEKKLLKAMGLNNYETAVYLKLAEFNTAEAGKLCKESGVPFGRIYEVLNSLEKKSLVDIEYTRPKKYTIKRPKTAFINILKNKRQAMETEFQKTAETICRIENKILNHTQEDTLKEKPHWTTAGKDEIEEMTISNFDEAKENLFVMLKNNTSVKIQDSLKNTLIALADAIKRGVKVRLLVGNGFSIPEDNLQKKYIKQVFTHAEVRFYHRIRYYFDIADIDKVILKINNPVNERQLIAAIRTTDAELAGELKKKFRAMWIRAKKLN